jgi:hypothetical protein
MKVKIGTTFYDAKDQSIAIIFRDDEERELVIKHLQNMPPKEGERWYAQHPSGISDEAAAEFFEVDLEYMKRNRRPTSQIEENEP